MAESHNNLVIQTNILKSLEVLEDKARKEWPKKWGFYLDLPQIVIEEAAKRGLSEEKYKEIMNRKRNTNRWFHYEEHPTAIVEPADHVPTTSSGFVGWRSESKHSLEILGPLYVSPKNTLPYQPPYNCVFLG